jgi:hypothetical protein
MFFEIRIGREFRPKTSNHGNRVEIDVFNECDSFLEVRIINLAIKMA